MSDNKKVLPWELPRFRNWIAVGRVNQLVRKSLGDALLGQGLDLPTYDVLAAVFRYEGLTQSELSEKLLVGRSNLSMLLPDLEALGWLKRETDEKDKRIRRVFLTTSGKARARAGIKVQVKLIEHMMGSISDEECDAAGDMMRKVIQYMEEKPFNA